MLATVAGLGTALSCFVAVLPWLREHTVQATATEVTHMQMIWPMGQMLCSSVWAVCSRLDADSQVEIRLNLPERLFGPDTTIWSGDGQHVLGLLFLNSCLTAHDCRGTPCKARACCAMTARIPPRSAIAQPVWWQHVRKRIWWVAAGLQPRRSLWKVTAKPGFLTYRMPHDFVFDRGICDPKRTWLW